MKLRIVERTYKNDNRTEIIVQEKYLLFGWTPIYSGFQKQKEDGIGFETIPFKSIEEAEHFIMSKYNYDFCEKIGNEYELIWKNRLGGPR